MNEINIMDLLKNIWAKKRWISKWTAVGALLGLLVAFSIPKEYVSTVEMVPEGGDKQGSARSSMGALAGMVGLNMGDGQEAGLTSAMYPQVVKSAPFLKEFAAIEIEVKGVKMSFYDYILKEQSSPWWSYVLRAPMAAVSWVLSIGSEATKPAGEFVYDIKHPTLEQFGFEHGFSKRINATSDKKTDVITLSCEMQDPEVAALIADSLYSKLQRYMVAYHTEKARENLVFSEEMYVEAKEKYYQADMLYASTVDKNRNLIAQSAQIKIERLKEERNIAFAIYQQLASQVESDRLKLQEQTPIATVITPARVAVRADSPNKVMYIIGFTVLFGLVLVSITSIKFVAQSIKKNGVQ